MRLSIWLAVCFGGIVWAAGAMAAESGLEVAPSDWNIARPESAAEAVADELAVAVDVVVQEADIMAQQIADTINVQAPEVVAQLDLLIDAVDPVAVSVNENIAWTIPGSPVGDGATVVRTSEAALAELPDTLTDMQVLARIVTKSADPENEWGVEGSAQRLYLEGHGLVLLLRVPFPLAPRADVGIAAERETDRLWRETANELWGATPEPAARVAYDAAKVDRLRDRLVEALPYARNVRGLPADGELTVIVAGDAFGRGNAAGLGWYTPMVSQFGGAIAGYSSVRSSSGDDSRLVVSVPLSAVRELRHAAIDEATFANRITTRTVPETDGELRRDLDVLSHVARKVFRGHVGGDGDDYRRGPFLSAGGNTSKARYINGYGVIVEMQVGFPLVAPDPGAVQDDAAAEPSSLWEDTQREILGAAPRVASSGGVYTAYSLEGQAYDDGKVTATKEAAVDLLLETTNFGALGDDESVVVIVRGPAPQRGATDPDAHSLALDNRIGRLLISTGGFGHGAAAVLTAHATKQDIDRQVAGLIARDEFRRRVTFASTVEAGAGRRSGHGRNVTTGMSLIQDPMLPTPPSAVSPPSPPRQSR